MHNSFDPYFKWLGVHPDEQPPNHYRLLGLLLFESDREVIRNAADQRMVYLKTFAIGKHSALSQKLLNELAAAKVCLLDVEKKAAYDQELRAKQEAESSPKPLSVASAVSPPDELTAPELVEPVSRSVAKYLSRRKQHSWQLVTAVGVAAALCIWLAVRALSRRDSEEVAKSSQGVQATTQSGPVEAPRSSSTPEASTTERALPDNGRAGEESLQSTGSEAQPQVDAKETADGQLSRDDSSRQPPGTKELDSMQPARGLPEIVLSSGKVFRRQDFQIDTDAAVALVESWAKGDESVVQVRHGSLFYVGYARQAGGNLNGITVLFRDEETPMLYVNYVDNKRDGLVRLWDADSRDRYFSEWSGGKRDGVCCLFDKNEPWMVSECVEDEYVLIALVSPGKQIKRFTSVQEAERDQTARAALEAVTDIENQIKKIHLSLGRNVREEAKKAEEERKSQAASRLGAQKQRRMTARIGARGRQRNAAVQGLRRSTGLSN